MTNRRNYYEIIDKLSFDPIEMKDKKIIDAIELWKLLEEKRGISNEDTNGEQRQQELDMYEDIKACLTDKIRRKEEADAMRQKQKKKLEDIIAVLKESSGGKNLYVSNARIVSIAKNLRLDKEKTVKKTFTDAGFEIIVRKPVNITNDILLSNTVFKTVSDNTEKLSRMSSKDYPWLSKVRNLYDLAAYFMSDDSNCDIYSAKPADELKGIMEAGAASVAGKLDTLNHCFGDLFHAGIEQIFKDEKTKAKYDNSLKIGKLYDLFLLIKEMPDEMKKDPYIADVCIKKIQTYFPDPDVSLAIYNKEAGNILDPYEPDSGDVDFICGSCKSTTKIKYGTNRVECKCQACQAPLFVKCPNNKCGALIPAIADICPECGFNIIETKFFDRYCALAKSAIDSLDIDEARKQLALAKNARPDDERLKKLDQEITRKIQELEKPLKEIRATIAQKKYLEAKHLLSSFCAKYPEAKVDDIRAQISSTLSIADAMFSSIEKQSDKCGVCFDILDKVCDYSKAIEYIKGTRPQKVTEVKVTVSTKSNQITIQWKGTGEREVSYYVVRNENKIPQSINDGKLILKEELVTQCTDSVVVPGMTYYYAVFAYRLGTFSEPASSECAVLYKELDENALVKNADDGKCILSWQLPNNCKGVRILRSENGKAEAEPSNNTKVIAECVTNGYEDRNVTNGVRYEYRLQCLYSIEHGFRHSEGITLSLMPDSKPQQAKLTSVQVKSENAIQITWTVDKPDDNTLLDLYDLKQGVQITEGTTYHIAELESIGNKIATISDIASNTAEIHITQKKGYRICSVIVKGEYGVISNCLSFSNYDRVEIDKTQSKITGGNLVIKLKNSFQQNLTNIRYAIATKNNDNEPAPWCRLEDAPGMIQIALGAYISDGMIRIEKVPEKELYITVIGEYVIGKETFYSEPSKLRISNKPKSVISYKMLWGFLNKKKKVKLVYECDTDQEIPEMLLCTNKTVKVPISPNAPNSVVLCRIEENLDYKAHTKMEIDITDSVWDHVTKGNEIRLFIPEECYSEFRMSPEIVTLTIP